MRILKTTGRDPVAVYSRQTSGGSNTLRVAIRQRQFGEARAAIAALFGGILRLKHIFVFDEDIDIRNDLQVEWALGTRFQADQDLMILQGMVGMPMDPSLQGRKTGAKSGFDCTRPVGRDREIPMTRSAAKVFKGPARFQTVEQALSTAPMFYADIVEAIGSDDGREIACGLDELRQSGKLGRDRDGRYHLAASKPGVTGIVGELYHDPNAGDLSRSPINVLPGARRLCCGLLLMHAPAARAADKVVAGSLGGQAPLWAIYVAVHKGFFTAEGLDLELNFAQSGAAVTQQLTGGSLDVALSVGITDPIRAIDKGAPLALIRIVGNAAPYVLIGKPGLKSIADLKGKTISTGADNDITTVYFERMMAANGLKKGDYTTLPAGVAAARFAALKAGVVDAAVVLPPVNFVAEKAGFVTLGFAADYVKDLPFTGMAVNRRWAGGQHGRRQKSAGRHRQECRLARRRLAPRGSGRAPGQGRQGQQGRRRSELRLSSPHPVLRARQQGVAKEAAQSGRDGAAGRHASPQASRRSMPALVRCPGAHTRAEPD